MKNGLISYDNGAKAWYLNGKIHREDGPAVEYTNGNKYWWLSNKLVFSKSQNSLHLFPNLTESFKLSIIKYRLTV
jgi:hypothetical protein